MTAARASRRIAGLLLGLAALVALPVRGAEEDSDTLFQRALSLPKERREEARALCRKALERSPDYHDIRIQLARYHAWDGQWEDARREIQVVLTRSPKNAEARGVAIDIEVWSDHPHAALRLCDEGMIRNPKNPEWPYRKARVLRSLKDLPGAYAALRSALLLDPNHQPSRLLRDDLKELLQRSKVSLDVSYETYDQTFDPWKTVSMSLGHRFDMGTVILRGNRVNRFDTWGTQVEVDAYPHIADGTYAYLNLGHSGDSIFPHSSSGAELYHNFPRGLEASLGLRHLVFSEGVTIYTGSIGKYYGNGLYSLRLNSTPSSVGSSLSGALSARLYQEDADSYFTASIGIGVSPDQPIWSEAVLKLHSRKASLGMQKRLTRSWLASASAGWERQEYLPDLYRNHWTYSMGIERRF